MTAWLARLAHEQLLAEAVLEQTDALADCRLGDLEPTLTRHGYRIKDLVEQFDARPTEIKALFSNALDPARAAELRDKMLAAGLPI